MPTDFTNLTVYTDEVHDDPSVALKAIPLLGIRSVCLRQLWGSNAGATSDAGCQRVMALLKQHDLSVAILASNCGYVPAEKLQDDFATVKRAVLVAAYFKVKFIRFFAGLQTDQQSNITAIDVWMSAVAAACEPHNITPLLDLDPRSQYISPDFVHDRLKINPTWRFQYDPAVLVINKTQDPSQRYLPLLSSKIAAIDIHDFETGHGFRPVGHGSCHWPAIVTWLRNVKYDGWFCLEPGLGQRYGSAQTKLECASFALSAFKTLLK